MMHRLIGREPIDFNPRGGYLTGSRVLITGAGGSIGSELARLVDRFDPAELVLFGHGESTLLAANDSIGGRGVADLDDIRDAARVCDAFIRYSPEVVFHVAALKHQPVLERLPYEAFKTNVLGSCNVMAYANACGYTHTFVNVSTDKAADPVCVLGASKRIAERVASAHGFTSVRFGNVIGSRGSVLHTFARQLANGEPITVTNPDVDRFFMTPSEAARSVVLAGSFTDRSAAYVMDMGAPVKIADLALRMAEFMGVTPNVVFTGLRPGEKLHERLLGVREYGHQVTGYPFRKVLVPKLEPTELNLVVVDGELVSSDSQLVVQPADVIKQAMINIAYRDLEGAE